MLDECFCIPRNFGPASVRIPRCASKFLYQGAEGSDVLFRTATIR